MSGAHVAESRSRLTDILQRRFTAWNRMPRSLRTCALTAVRRVTRLDEIDALLTLHADKSGAAFLDAFFDALDFSYAVSSQDRIPSAGRVVVVANHPLGAMDALALLRALLDVRPDVYVVVNELLMQVTSLAAHFLPFDMFSAHPPKRQVIAIGRTLAQNAALVIFPAGDVSHLTLAGVRDRAWSRSPARLASAYGAPVLPVFIGGRNALPYYVCSSLSRTLASVLLPREIFRQRGRTVRVAFGDLIPSSAFERAAVSGTQLRNHVYRVGRLDSACDQHRTPVEIWRTVINQLNGWFADGVPSSAASKRSRESDKRETST